MKFYISFGQIHIHSICGLTIDKNCLVELNATSKSDAHEMAMDIFDKKFHNVYDALPDMDYFPRGVIKL